MSDYQIDVAFDTTNGAIDLHVFDLNDDSEGPVSTCSVGENLETDELREAWGQFHK